MSEIFNTTMDPTKHQLMAAWLPQQDWFAGEGEPVLETLGGFRLDDPAGEVGMEFIVVADTATESPVIYHVPLSYRGQELPGAEASLLGTSEHGVLGKRWIYDGTGDPVWQAQVRALLAGQVEAQHQNTSFTLEPLVKVQRPAQDGVDHADTEIRVIRRPVVGGSASDAAAAWVSSPWNENGVGVGGAVLEFS